jgi:hypothetical protein
MSRRTSYGAPTLALWPDEEDVELPLDEEQDPALRAVAGLGRNVTALVDALAECLVALECGRPIAANRLRTYRTLVGRPAIVDEPATPEERRDEGIARASAKWTDEEAAAVDAAIRTVAEVAADMAAQGEPFTEGLGLGEFTTADVWQELGTSVPVTKGIAGRMTAAKSAGLIANTGRTIIAPKDATGPNHGQRLTVWRAA